CTSTCALPDTQTLRCSGVDPMDGLISADSFTRRAVTFRPLGRGRLISPPGSGTKVSAFAAPVENRPMAATAAAASPAARAALFFSTDIAVSLSEMCSVQRRSVSTGRTSADAERSSVQGGFRIVVADDFEHRVGAGLRIAGAAFEGHLDV